MSAWTIFDFVNAGGVNEIRPWMDSLPKKAQARIDSIIRYLQIVDVWPGQYISDRKDCDKIYELRIASGGVQYRPLGFFGPQRREFTILLGATEKGGKLEPRDFCTIATRLRGLVNANRKHVEPHRYG
jgi:hypothetical protein